MRPILETLEDRNCPSAAGAADPFALLQVALPSFVPAPLTYQWLELETFLGQPAIQAIPGARQLVGPGLPWQPNTVIQLDLTSAQATLLAVPTRDDARNVIQVGLTGQLPVILAAPGVQDFADVDSWELPSLELGWWYSDWPAGSPGWPNSSLMTPGPQYGQTFQPPNYTIADALFAQDSPYWFLFW